MGLRWAQEGEVWVGYDGDRYVAMASRRWLREGRWVWQARWWGDRPAGVVPLSLGRDPALLDGEWPGAEGAMAAVDARHDAA